MMDIETDNIERPLSPVGETRSPPATGEDFFPLGTTSTETNEIVSSPLPDLETQFHKNLESITTAECDYDINPTELYQAIESKHWEHAMRLLKSEGTESNRSGIEQAKVWVVRKERDGKLRWRMMPIHASIIFKAPYGIVEGILSVAPITAQFKDDQGMLPLHLAFRNDATDDVIDELLTAYPTAIEIKDRKGRVPLLCGNSRGNANRWKLLGTYTALAVACEKKKITSKAKLDLEKEMSLERKVQEESMRLLKEQNDLKLNDADSMMEAVVEEIKRIQELSNVLKESMNAKTVQEQSVEHQLKEVQKEKADFEQQILSNNDAADTRNLSPEILIQYNSFIDEEKKLQEELKILHVQKGVGVAIPEDLMEEIPITNANVTEKVMQLGHVLQNTELKLKEEVGAKAHIQQKLEDTIDKQLVLTEELVTVKTDLEKAYEENTKLRSHIGATKGQVDEFTTLKFSYDKRIEELTKALRKTTEKLGTLLKTSVRQKTEVEASFAVRERMLQAISRQEADMVKAATEKDEITDIARALKMEVESLLMKKSPLIGITELVMNVPPQNNETTEDQ